MFRKSLQVSSTDPGRHMMKNYCPCQYIESHLKCKPQGEIFVHEVLDEVSKFDIILNLLFQAIFASVFHKRHRTIICIHTEFRNKVF